MKEATTANTLFNRLRHLNIKLSKFETKQLGQLVKERYQSQYGGKLPEKIVIKLLSQRGDELLRNIAVYPDSFKSCMDQVIHQFMKMKERREQNVK